MSEAVSMFVVTTFFPVHLAAQTPKKWRRQARSCDRWTKVQRHSGCAIGTVEVPSHFSVEWRAD